MAYDPYTRETTNDIFTALSLQQTLSDNSSTQALSNGIMLQQKKKYKEALAAYKQAAAYNPLSVDAYNGIASAYTLLGEKQKAIDAYKLSLKVDRNQKQAEQLNINIANLYIEMKKPVDAEKALKGALQVNSTSVLARYTMGHLYLQNNRLKDAEEQFRLVVKLVPKDGNANYGLGLTLNKEGRYEEAIKSLTKAVSLKKDFAAAIGELGVAYASLGQTENAQKQIDLLKKLDTAQAKISADFLAEKLKRPKISAYDSETSSLNLYLAAGSSLIMVDPAFITPSTTQSVTAKFTFDSEMDASSVTNISNWKISKPRGGDGGLYDNGLYRSTDAMVQMMPSFVTYDPTNKQATVTFLLGQNASGDATIDPTHLTFKFSGKDAQGRTMDPTADEFNGFKDVAF